MNDLKKCITFFCKYFRERETSCQSDEGLDDRFFYLDFRIREGMKSESLD